LRLSEALARLRWADQVSEGDVNEALRLIKMSKISLEDTAGDDTSKFDPITAIYMVREDSTIALNQFLLKFDLLQAIRDWADAQPTSEVRYDQAVALVISKGYTVEVCTIFINDFCDFFSLVCIL